METTFEYLPSEIHSLISDYLRCIDITCLCLSSTQLRSLYHSKAYRSIEVLGQAEFEYGDEQYVSDKIEMMETLSDSGYETRISLDIFLNPERYSWFPNEQVRQVFIAKCSFDLTSKTFPYSQIIKLYPRLRFFTLSHREMHIFTSETLRLFYYDQTYNLPTTLEFFNLAPFLQSLQDESDSPAPIGFIPRNQSPRIEIDMPDRTNNNDNELKLFSNSQRSMLRDYYDEELLESEENFKFMISLIEPDPPKEPVDLATQWDKVFTTLCVFPRPSWTDFITKIDITVGHLGAFDEQGSLSKAFTKLYSLDRYPNLRTVSVFENDHVDFSKSEPIYDSLERCDRLNKLNILYRHENNDNEQLEQFVAKINQLRGKWTQFKLNLMNDSQPCSTWPLEIKNPTITHFSLFLNDAEKEFSRFIFNHETLKSLSLTLDKCGYRTVNEALFLLSSYHMRLEKLDIFIRSFGSSNQCLLSMISLFKKITFPHLTELSITGNSSYEFSQFRQLETTSPYDEYMTYLLDVVKFGEPFETYGQAVKVFQHLKKKASSSTKVVFSKERIDRARSNVDFRFFYECYDHGPITNKRECCKRDLSSSMTTNLYLLFAFIFKQIILDEVYGLERDFFNYLQCIQIPDMFYRALPKSFPKLSSLRFSYPYDTYATALLPSFQKFCRKRKNLELTINNSCYNWKGIIRDDYTYKDEWINEAFHKASFGGPYYIGIDANRRDQVDYILENFFPYEEGEEMERDDE